ncbi:MAG: glycosyltransferase [Opitutaceae bacterium]
MKIAFVTSKALSRHATIKRAWGMAPHLLEAGHSVRIICEECEENRETASGIRGLRVSYFASGLDVRGERRAKLAAVLQEQPDVTHICGLGWRNAISIPHGTCLMDHVELESAIATTSFVRRLLQGRLERWSFRHYSGSIAASRYLEHEIRRYTMGNGISRPILWLPFAFDERMSRPEGREVARFRAAAAGRKTIAYMGGLYRDYGIFELIEGYLSSEQLRNEARLVIIGRGPEADYVRNRVRVSGEGARVEFLGYIDEAVVPAFLHSCDVLVSPLRNTIQDWARCPSKTYMYIATGKPIVTSAIGENREALGESGFYYEPGNVGSLGRALLRALQSEGGSQYDVKQHSWSRRVEVYRRWLAESFGLSG